MTFPARFFRKTVEAEVSRLETLLATQERSVRQAFAAFVRDVKSEPVLKEVADLLERGDVEGALRVVDTYVNRLGVTIPELFRRAAEAEATALAPQIAELAPSVGVAFDPTWPAAVEQARRAQLEFVRLFTDTQREATRNALVLGMQEGRGGAALARDFRDSIGLTPRQEAAVRTYRRLLEAGSRDALSRELRDRRHDRTVERAAQSGEPIPQETVDAMVDRYRARYLAFRAETIARTESVRITSQAREESFRQQITSAGIAETMIEQEWKAVRDNRTRETHRDLDGQKQPLGQPFQSASGAVLRYPGDPNAPAAEIINCRCHRIFRIRARLALETAV